MNQNKPKIDELSSDPLDEAIESARNNMRRLIDCYSGAKTIHQPLPPRTETDDQRLLWTLKQLRARIAKLQKQRDQFNRNGEYHE